MAINKSLMKAVEKIQSKSFQHGRLQGLLDAHKMLIVDAPYITRVRSARVLEKKIRKHLADEIEKLGEFDHEGQN